MTMNNLITNLEILLPQHIKDEVYLLPGFVEPELITLLLKEIEQITQISPFRQMLTPGGYTMSVAMTNCGNLGRNFAANLSWGGPTC